MQTGLKHMLGKEAVAVPGAFDAASALLVEKAGFRAVYVSGAGLSNSRGLPDAGIITRDEAIRLSTYIIKAVRVPVIVDADTGYGGPVEVEKTVRAFEDIGASAIQIEDQEFPKRCGHLPGKTVIPAAEFAQKLRAAVKARKNKDFLIIARTDARAVNGMEDAIGRARLYIDSGADAIFPEALESAEEFKLFSESINSPLVANMTEFGKTPYITVEEFRAMGYSMVLFPMTAFRAAMKAMEETLATLKEKGTQKEILPRLQTREALYRLIGYEVKG